MNQNFPCPCNSQLAYQDCCSRYHNQIDFAPTAEVLMRSRYCAFALKQYGYLIATHHNDYLDGLTETDLAQVSMNWLGLDVLEHKLLSEISADQFDGLLQASVTFKAWYKLEEEIDAIYEKSRFVQQNGRWYYINGEQMTVKLPGRNEACICKSGKKFKQCCLKK